MIKLFNQFGKTVAKIWLIVLAYNVLPRLVFLLVALFLIIRRLGYKRSMRQAKRTLKQVIGLVEELEELKERLA